MKIGTVRPEEARVFDTHAGYHSFHSEPINPDADSTDFEGRNETGSFLIYWQDHEPESDGSEEIAAGWYWRAQFPGCMPDGDPMGPFASSRAALYDADEWNPEFDE